MQTIGELLEAKDKDIWPIAPHATGFEALQIMYGFDDNQAHLPDPDPPQAGNQGQT